MEPLKGDVMTQAEEVRELRNWLREDAAKTSTMVDKLHSKIDHWNTENQREHRDLRTDIANIQTVGAVNKAKIIGLVAIISVAVTKTTGFFWS